MGLPAAAQAAREESLGSKVAANSGPRFLTAAGRFHIIC